MRIIGTFMSGSSATTSRLLIRPPILRTSTIVNGRAENRGVEVEHVERVTGRPVERVAVERATTPEDARRLASEGRPVVYAPLAVD